MVPSAPVLDDRSRPGAVGPERRGAVVAVKDLSRAKTRLTSLSPALRGRLAALMAVTVTRALTEVVDRVVVVTTAPGIGPLLAAHGLRVPVVPDPRAGLNAAFAAGEQALRREGCSLLVACMADLPAVTTAALADVLDRCTGTGRWFVRDDVGTGTTLLAARGLPLDPRFGPGSAAQHAASGATELEAQPGVRLDVDEPPDLARAAALGLGEPALALLGEHETGVVIGPAEGGWLVLTAAGSRVYAGPGALGPDLLRPAPGQRVHLVRDGTGAVSQLWI